MDRPGAVFMSYEDFCPECESIQIINTKEIIKNHKKYMILTCSKCGHEEKIHLDGRLDA